MNDMKTAKFAIGQVVRHRLFPFRGIIFDGNHHGVPIDEPCDVVHVPMCVVADAPFPYQVDGDYLGEVQRLELVHEPAALRLVLPG